MGLGATGLVSAARELNMEYGWIHNFSELNARLEHWKLLQHLLLPQINKKKIEF